MKKTVRSILLILALSALFLTFTACNPVPEMRANHAAWNEDGSISFDGKTYLMLPPCDKLDLMIDYGRGTVWVTDADVPVLLSRTMGASFLSCQNGDFLIESYGSEIVYCVEELYADVLQSIEMGDPMLYYCFEQVLYDPESGAYSPVRQLVPEEVASILTLILAQDPIDLPSGITPNYYNSVPVYRCSKSMAFLAPVFEIRFSSTGDSCYLAVEREDSATVDCYLVEEPYLALIREVFFPQ